MCIELRHIQQQGVTFDGVLKAGYDLNYTYGAKPHQIEKIADENYRTEGKDVKKPKKTENVYEYDLNGNLIFVSKNKSKDEKQNERKLLWDEENRLEAVSDNGYVSLYTYDAGGERVAKLSGNGESVYVNSKNAGKRTQTNRYTAYISPYFVLSSGGQYTKHIMIGSQRIVSKLGDVKSFGQDPRRVEYAGTTESIKVDYKTKYQKSQQIFRERYKALKVVYNGVDNNDYRGGESFCCGKKKDGFKARSSGGGITNNDKPELHQYYYHPDHLGSSSYITNLDGEVAQHIEYVPFGEVFIKNAGGVDNIEDEAVRFQNYLYDSFGYDVVRTKYSGRSISNPKGMINGSESGKYSKNPSTNKIQPAMMTLWMFSWDKEVPMPNE